MNKRVLITGISGYLGSSLARSLAKKGFEVHGIIRPSSDLVLLGSDAERYQLHTFPGANSMDSMVRILEQSKPETVFHLASLFKPSHVTSDVVPLVESNIVFGAQLLEAMAVTGARNLVNTGTIWQNFDGQPYNPVALYAATKQAFDDLVRFYAETDKIQALTLKLTDTFGPGDPRRKLFKLIVQASNSPEPFAMTGGEQLIDLVHVDDVVRAFEAGAEAVRAGGFRHRIRQVATGAPIQVRKLVEIFESVSGRKVPVVWGKIPYRPREMFKNWQADPLLEGWTAQVSLEEGIRSILS